MIDLNTCQEGDLLRSRYGLILIYKGKCPEGSYYDHYIEYPNGTLGTRTNDGFVFKNKRMPEDEDVVKIL